MNVEFETVLLMPLAGDAYGPKLPEGVEISNQRNPERKVELGFDHSSSAVRQTTQRTFVKAHQIGWGSSTGNFHGELDTTTVKHLRNRLLD